MADGLVHHVTLWMWYLRFIFC